MLNFQTKRLTLNRSRRPKPNLVKTDKNRPTKTNAVKAVNDGHTKYALYCTGRCL